MYFNTFEKKLNIYFFLVLAPPSNLRTKGEPKNSTISIEWDTPRVSNLLILEFKVLVHLNFSYSPDRSRFQNRSLKVSNTTLAANIIGND